MTKLIIGSNSQKIGRRLCERLGLECIKANVTSFEDSEFCIQLEGDLKEQNVLIVQSTSRPVNGNLMELLFLVDAAKRSGARRVITFVPYFGYSRQDRSTSLHEPLSAHLVAKFFETAGVDCLVTIDWHSKNIKGFFNIEVQNIETTLLFADALKGKSNLMIVSPDTGGAERAQKLSQALGVSYAVISKIRKPDSTCIMNEITGNVAGYHCVLVDDIVDTGNTLCRAAELLMQRGALSVEVFVTHGVLSGQAIERIEKSALERITITETIEQRALPPKFNVLYVTPLLSDAVCKLFY